MVGYETEPEIDGVPLISFALAVLDSSADSKAVISRIQTINRLQYTMSIKTWEHGQAME